MDNLFPEVLILQSTECSTEKPVKYLSIDLTLNKQANWFQQDFWYNYILKQHTANISDAEKVPAHVFSSTCNQESPQAWG